MNRIKILVAALFFTASACAVHSAAKPAKRYLITDFGAVADGKTVNTKSIQAAIDKCASSGGGVLVVPKGTFLSGAIFLKQGVNLLVEKDGVSKRHDQH
jgi:polygalacturonase